MAPRKPLHERFWSKVNKDGPEVIEGSPCWLWTGYILHYPAGSRNGRGGYGFFTDWPGKPRPAHRWAWMLTRGEIPEGLFVLHACHNPPCVRPDHLRLGTHAENMRDMVAAGHSHRGERSPTAVLSEDLVMQMRHRARAGENIKNIADSLGLAYMTAVSAVRGKSWRHLPGRVPQSRRSPAAKG